MRKKVNGSGGGSDSPLLISATNGIHISGDSPKAGVIDRRRRTSGLSHSMSLPSLDKEAWLKDEVILIYIYH
jgi:hypothetical protein